MHPDRYDNEAGWAVVSELLSSDDIAETLAICRRLLALPAHERDARDRPHGGTQHLADLDRRSEFVASLVERPALVDVVAAILGPTFRRVEVAYRSPQPSFGSQQLHADDLPRMQPASNTIATAIVALTAFTTDNGATRLIPGSHRRPDLQRRAGSLDTHTDEITLTGAAGTAFVFSGHLLHSGTTNQSAFERPALQVIWRT
ncbi:MAG: phytanoyl-CoA dioxygenase family protein [Acidimicrobiales bacterium]